MKQKAWGIIGLGWLGSAFQERLQETGVDMWGTHRADFDFAHDQFPKTACDVLFLNTPPLRQIPPAEFVAKIQAPKNAKLIFISSTSVFGEIAGTYTELSLPNPTSESGQWLAEVEILLRDRFGTQLSIIRPGGLIGGKRHPIFSLSGKTQVAGGGNPVHLIHRDDLITLILAVAEGQIPLVNAIAPYHPTKDVYYNDWAKKLNLPPVEFTQDRFVDRQIRSEILSSLGITWKCPKLDSL